MGLTSSTLVSKAWRNGVVVEAVEEVCSGVDVSLEQGKDKALDVLIRKERRTILATTLMQRYAQCQH
jgi:hypothetical protein